MKPKLTWYGCKKSFKLLRKSDRAVAGFEERVLLFKARDEVELGRMMAKEVKEYCRVDPQTKYLIRPVGRYHEVFFIADSEQGDNPLEVYSKIHHGMRSEARFLKRNMGHDA